MLCILAIHVFFIIPGKLIIFSTEIYLNKRSLKKKKNDHCLSSSSALQFRHLSVAKMQ